MMSTTGALISTRTVSSKGQITISTAAREHLALSTGDQLLELVIDRALVYIPADEALTLAQDTFARSLAERGISIDDMLADIEAHKDEVYDSIYGKIDE